MLINPLPFTAKRKAFTFLEVSYNFCTPSFCVSQNVQIESCSTIRGGMLQTIKSTKSTTSMATELKLVAEMQ